MQDILKVIRFDFLTMSSVSMGELIFVILFCLVLSMLLSPLIAVMITFCVFGFVYPLQDIAERNGFSKLYGTLPVDRRNVTRARFIYIFAAFLICELTELVIAVSSTILDLNKLIFNIDRSAERSREMLTYMHMIYDTPAVVYLAVFAVAAVCCIAEAYMEMMSQIYGRENLFRSVMIGIAALSAVIGGVYLLSSYTTLIPQFHLMQMTENYAAISVSESVIFGAASNAAMLAVCLVFGEITTRIVSEREI